MWSSVLLVILYWTFEFVQMQDSASTEDLCSPAVGRMRNDIKNVYVEIPQTCTAGKISYHHSDKEMVVTFDRVFPYRVCIQNSTQYLLFDEGSTNFIEMTPIQQDQPMDENKSTRSSVEDRKLLCVDQIIGGQHSVLISPTSHYYVCEINYVIYRLRMRFRN